MQDMYIYSWFLVHGGWSDFGDWGPCSVSCGGGKHSRTRVCNNPSPEFGGNDCTIDGSSDTETNPCNEDHCPSMLSKTFLT